MRELRSDLSASAAVGRASRGCRFLFLLFLALPLVGCGEDFGAHRFRLTVEIDTPDGVRSGLSVLEAAYSRFGGNAHAELRGQAVVVDLGKGRDVFALMSHGLKGEDTDQFAWLPVTALTGATWGWSGTDALKRRGNRLEGVVELRPPLIPTFATFADAQDPKTVQLITRGNFGSLLGAGYSLKRVTLEIVPSGIWPFNLMPLSWPSWLVGERVTSGIEGKLPWSKTVRGYLSGRFSCNPRVEICLDVGMFRRG